MEAFLTRPTALRAAPLRPFIGQVPEDDDTVPPAGRSGAAAARCAGQGQAAGRARRRAARLRRLPPLGVHACAPCARDRVLHVAPDDGCGPDGRPRRDPVVERGKRRLGRAVRGRRRRRQRHVEAGPGLGRRPRAGRGTVLEQGAVSGGHGWAFRGRAQDRQNEREQGERPAGRVDGKIRGARPHPHPPPGRSPAGPCNRRAALRYDTALCCARCRRTAPRWCL